MRHRHALALSLGWRQMRIGEPFDDVLGAQAANRATNAGSAPRRRRPHPSGTMRRDEARATRSARGVRPMR